jgi:hypothetical protein
MTNFDEKMKALGVHQIFDERPAPPDPTLTFASLENDLGARLPDDYKAFATTYGHHGFEQYVGVPVEPRFPLGKTCLVSSIFGCNPGLRYYLVEERRKFEGRMPAHLLPLASDPGGNLFVLSVGQNDYGKVYYWDHDHVELSKARVQEMSDELEDEGVDTSQLFIDGIILAWDELHPDELDRPPGYGNLYRVGDSFAAFVDALHPYAPEAT